MATRTVTTSTSNLSNNILTSASTVLGHVLVGSRIRGADIRLINQLMVDLCGHTHTWNDLFGQHSGGNKDPDGYGAGVGTRRTVDPAVPGAGTPPNTGGGFRIYADDINFGINLHNQVINHSHRTVDQES